MNIQYTNTEIAKYRQIREEQKRFIDRERLKKVAQQKIRTTMIGAIATLESHFGFLWSDDPSLKEIFDEVRSEILDKGNNQMRNFEAEISNYDVKYNKPKITIPVKEPGNDSNNNE
jgi:hypothetical protein